MEVKGGVVGEGRGIMKEGRGKYNFFTLCSVLNNGNSQMNLSLLHEG